MPGVFALSRMATLAAKEFSHHTMNNSRVFRAGLLCLVCMLTFLLTGVPGGSSPGGEPDSFEHERFYRAAFILKFLDENSRKDPLVIPSRIAHADATESLLHHPDRIFVLRTLSSELASVRRAVPKAPLYEAFARLALGEKQKGAELLILYVGGTGFDAAQYRLLCRTLSEMKDYPTLHIICREWAERAKREAAETGGDAERAKFGWEAMHGLGRYAEARFFVLQEKASLGWRASVFAAQSALAQGDETEARQIIAEAIAAYRQSEAEILRQWETVSSSVLRLRDPSGAEPM